MTAVPQVEPTFGRHPLAPGATAKAIREHLLEEDRAGFDRAVRQAELNNDPAAARQTLEHWRCVAMAQQDREAFTRTARRLAERRTGQPSPEEEPLAVTRAKAGM